MISPCKRELVSCMAFICIPHTCFAGRGCCALPRFGVGSFQRLPGPGMLNRHPGPKLNQFHFNLLNPQNPPFLAEVAFQNRNPIHRAHFELLICARRPEPVGPETAMEMRGRKRVMSISVGHEWATMNLNGAHSQNGWQTQWVCPLRWCPVWDGFGGKTST